MLSETGGGELFRQLIEGVPDAIVVVDQQGLIVFVNRQCEVMFGYQREVLIGGAIERLIPQRYAGRHKQHRAGFERAPTVRSMGSGLELLAARSDGSELPVEISLGPILVGGVRLTAATIRDVTERRKLEERSRRAASHLASAVESISDAFLLVDDGDRIVLSNNSARELLGADRIERGMNGTFEDFIDTCLSAAFLAGDGAERARVRAEWLAYHRAPVGSLALETATGHHLRLTARRIAEGGAVMLIADVSEDTLRSDELRRAREQAELANAAKSEFLASMSHELRTPLNAVLGFTQLLQRDRKTPPTERQQERLAHVMRGGEHLLRLIDEVLDLARIESGRVTISAELVAMGDVVAEVCATLEPLAQGSGITLRVERVAAVPLVRIDRMRLAQILMNFGSNAIKYGRTGGHVAFGLRLLDGHLRAFVKDDGLGIPMSHQATVFEPFQRAGQETGPIEGTGIGLTISKRLAEVMGCVIGFESQAGVGSEFWVDVPTSLSDEASPSLAPAGAWAPTQARLGRERMLVVYVEDNASNIAFMRAALDDVASIELVTAPNAEVGLELIRAQRPAIVIMDLNLPGMSGLEATRCLASWPETRDIPVIALSAAATTRDTALARDAGFYRYLTKPVRVDELVAVLDELVRTSGT